jgi:hypothetical protein
VRFFLLNRAEQHKQRAEENSEQSIGAADQKKQKHKAGQKKSEHKISLEKRHQI